MDYLSLFSSSLREKPRFMALSAAVLRQVTDLQALVPFLESGFSFAHASGLQLDALGDSVSLPRPAGWSDGQYRAFLLRKLKVWSWDGTNAGVPAVLEDGEMMLDNLNGTVTVSPADGVFPVPMGVRPVS